VKTGVFQSSAMRIEDLPAGVVDRIVERLRTVEPDALGVLVHGSYARGTAQPESDLDLAVLVPSPGPDHYRSWFEELPDGSLLYVSVDMDLTVERWEEQAVEAEDWSLGFPVSIQFEWVWTSQGGVRALLGGDHPIERHPAGLVEVGDIVETTTKVIRAAAAGDDDGVRMWASSLIAFVAPTIAAVNEQVEVRDPREALQRLLGLPNVPAGWRDDVRICLGLEQRESPEVTATARRLAMNVLSFLREGFPLVDKQPGVTEALVAGSYERWLATF
jgi:phosphoribosyl-AMP cyclohydrolase